MEKFSETFDLAGSFIPRHVGPREHDVKAMLAVLGFKTLEELSSAIVPKQIQYNQDLKLAEPESETELYRSVRKLAEQNQIYRSYIGMGYSDCVTPPVILRNILENPGWYTQYTPYQAEIAQGRLEALLNFQTMVKDLTGLEIANASMLDEGTAAAEAMTMAWGNKGRAEKASFFVSKDCHPQTIEVVRTRALPLQIEVIVGDHREFDFKKTPVFAALVQYPATDGVIYDYKEFGAQAHAAGAMFIVAADILSLAVLTPPGEFGADIAVGTTQRFGVPLGYGGPHAAFLATRDEFKRILPGRIVGVSQDTSGKPAYRLALQTREQHIRRDKATSNICTAQVLLAVIAGMFAVYHGPDGVRKIAERTNLMAQILQKGLKELGFDTGSAPFFDTVRVSLDQSMLASVLKFVELKRMNLRKLGSSGVTIALDEATTTQDLKDLLDVFAQASKKSLKHSPQELATGLKPIATRTSHYLSHPVFNTHRSETEMLRYIFKLSSKDLSLTTSMIPLGSCTMKLNATSEMIPVTMPEFGKIHPFAPTSQTKGYQAMLLELESMLEEITGFARISLQPNAGSQGEYTGLLVIRKYHETRGESHRNICLIPQSAHGTNPASAVMAGMKVVVVQCDSMGNVDLADLRAKATEHSKNLSALMVTYPSTHGVFEEAIKEVCQVVHSHGGQVYMDGANMNAQVGVCRPGDFGPDVCHLNLHKTFCIPHGGGGPGMGPIGVGKHLAEFLPSHPIIAMGGSNPIGPVSAAPWGSASILPISWSYIKMMGARGLREATQVAILNANYIAKRLESHYPILYKGKDGLVAHECIFDLRPLKASCGIEVEDVAKRLMDYGFHAPTVSFPVAGTIMVEPTESESKPELDRFCDAMIEIRNEIREIEKGKMPRDNNLLKHAPHTALVVTGDKWDRPYSRARAAYPLKWVADNKFWPAVSRINNVLGDRNLICTCPPISDFE